MKKFVIVVILLLFVSCSSEDPITLESFDIGTVILPEPEEQINHSRLLPTPQPPVQAIITPQVPLQAIGTSGFGENLRVHQLRDITTGVVFSLWDSFSFFEEHLGLSIPIPLLIASCSTSSSNANPAIPSKYE